MAYVPIPKDLSNVKNKIAFNLTKRQLICFGLAAFFGVITYFIVRNFLAMDLSALILAVVAMPFFFFAIYEKDGYYLEKIIQHRYETNFRRPKIRIYQTENFYKTLGETEKELSEDERRLESNVKRLDKRFTAIQKATKRK